MGWGCEVDIPNVMEVRLPNSFETVKEMEVESRSKGRLLGRRCASKPGISCEKGKWAAGCYSTYSEFVKDPDFLIFPCVSCLFEKENQRS